jgi:hypothetical protein
LCVCGCVLLLFILLGTLWRSNDTTKVHAHLFFLAPLVYSHALINQSKHQKYFHNKPWFQNQVIFSFFSFFLIKF